MASPVRSPKTVSFQINQHSREDIKSPLVTDSRPPQSKVVSDQLPLATNGENTSNADTASTPARIQSILLSEGTKAAQHPKSSSPSPLMAKSESLAPRMTSSEAARISQQVRDKSRAVAHEHVRAVKYDVAKLREHLLRVEEQVKVLSRGKRTLELAVQDVRKDLSTNQQSVGMQQKKTRNGEDMCLRLLEEERTVLSKCKRSVESHLQAVKNQLIALDAVRKSFQAKIASLSTNLDLDAQNFRICHNPNSPGPHTQGDYQSRCPLPKSVVSDEESATICTKATELVKASVAISAEIKSLIVTTQSRRMGAQDKVSSAISKKVEEADRQRGELLLERGQLRLAQSASAHQMHTEQLALGTLLGPVSEKHRSVSEKADCPQNRARPSSVCEERAEIHRCTAKLNRHLSAISSRSLDLSTKDEHLVKKLREEAQEAVMDSETLRIRRVPLQNRWVK